MRESVTYQAVLEEGLEKGKAIAPEDNRLH